MFKQFCSGFFVIVVLFQTIVPGQTPVTPESELTDAENRETLDLVKRFSVRLAETNSIGPLLDEFFAPNIVEQFKQSMADEVDSPSDDDVRELSKINPSQLMAKADPALWRRFYVAMHDFLYLMFVSYQRRGDAGDEVGLVESISPRANQVMRSNPHLALLLDDAVSDETQFSVDEMLAFVDTLEIGEGILREDLRTYPLALDGNGNGPDPSWSRDEPTLSLNVLGKEDYGLPVGTRTITVHLSVGLILVLARADEQFKIVWLGINDD